MTARLPTPGADNGTWGTILNDFLEVSLTPDGTLNPNTVGQDQLQTASVGTTQLQAGAVTTTTIANNAVTSTQLASAIQTNLSLASSSVQSVNSQTPSGSGAVTLTASELGALSTTNNLSDVSSTSSALANLGGAKALIDSGSSITTSGTILHQASERVDATSGAITRTAPAIVTGPPWDNTFLVKKIDTSSNVITISYPNTAGTTSTETLIGTNQAKAFRQTSGLGYEVEVDSNPLEFLETQFENIFNVVAYGAIGDGATDNTAAFKTAQTAIAGSGKNNPVLYVPPGNFCVTGQALYVKNSMLIRGAGWASTTITTLDSGDLNGVLQIINAVSSLIIEDIWFVGQNYPDAGLILTGNITTQAIVRRCKFTSFNCPVINASNLSGLIVEDCVFNDEGTPKQTSISLSNGCHNAFIRRNQFLWVMNGISISAGVTTADGVVTDRPSIVDNYFDLGWWLLTNVAENSGSTVTYTATTLTDTAASFTTLGIKVDDNVRVMPVLGTGTIAAVSPTTLTDSSATFITAGVARGHVVRAGLSFGVVAGVVSQTELDIEAWWDDPKRDTLVPSSGVSYTVYGIYIGRVTGVTSNTVLAIQYFHDFWGNGTTPTAGTRYEMMCNRCNYDLNLGAATRFGIISRNICRRGWSDQISVYGSYHIISNNYIEDGQDEGITADGVQFSITGNLIRHQGASCIYAQCNDSTVMGNTCADSPWQNNFSGYATAHIQVNGTNTVISGNRVVQTQAASAAQYGISIRSSYALVTGNLVTGTATSGIYIASGATYNSVVLNQATFLNAGGTTNSYLSIASASTSAYPTVTVAPGVSGTTTSTTAVMLGIGALITPTGTGSLIITFNGNLGQATAVNTIFFQARYGTGTPPVQGVAVTGTAIGGVGAAKPAIASGGEYEIFTYPVTLTGLSIGTQYWIDLAFYTGSASDTAEVSAGVTIQEVNLLT